MSVYSGNSPVYEQELFGLIACMRERQSEREGEERERERRREGKRVGEEIEREREGGGGAGNTKKKGGGGDGVETEGIITVAGYPGAVLSVYQQASLLPLLTKSEGSEGCLHQQKH